MKMKKGFSLIELIVVIGIIGILMAVLLSQFGGATESAKATQCMNNLRSLSIGMINAATAHELGTFPSAHSLKFKHIDRAKGVMYGPFKGWVSWAKNGETTTKGPTPGGEIYLGETDDDQLMFAITNGAIWTTSGKSRAIYTCPVHSELYQKKNGRVPGWSYVVNDRFGVQEHFSHGYMTVSSMSVMREKNKYKKAPADKILMFAELQAAKPDAKAGIAVPEPTFSPSGSGADGMLESDKGEVIGFNHKISGGKYVGHVAFADGHVDKLMLPKSGSLNELTKYLCQGYDVTFDGRQYTRVDE